MEYQKIINSLDNTLNQPTKFRTKNWAEVNDASQETYNSISKINPLRWPYKFYEGKNSGLSLQSFYRPDKEFTVLFWWNQLFLRNIV